MADPKPHRPRETRNIAWSTLSDHKGRIAEVLTYAVRKIGGTWEFKTVVIGIKGEEQRAWFGTWNDWSAAERGHADTCQKIHSAQGMILQ